MNYIDDQKAYLTQSGQLYVEATAAALGKVYTFGPTFRAEKSKTRRHFTEFWMLEPEAAFAHLEDMIQLGEGLVSAVVQSVVKNRTRELAMIERDVAKLEKITPPFPRISYDDAIKVLQKAGNPAKWGDDFGGDEETIISKEFDKPVIIHRYPAAMKAFYMATDAERPELSLKLRHDRSRRLWRNHRRRRTPGGLRNAGQAPARAQSARRIFSVVSRSAPLWQRAARRLRPGPRTHRRMDLRNGAHPRGDSLPSDAVSRLSLTVPSPESGAAKAQNMPEKIRIIGVPMDLGASRRGVDMGPSALRVAGLTVAPEATRPAGGRHRQCACVPQPEEQPYGEKRARYLDEISEACKGLADAVKKTLDEDLIPLVLGGDHSIAVGTTAGAAAHFNKNSKRIGVIWLDAHGDMNTPDSSPSGNVHGMPLASIMGYGPPELTELGGIKPMVEPRNVALVGIRDLDSKERRLMKDSGVHVFTMRDIDERGMREVMAEALRFAGDDTAGDRRQPGYGLRGPDGRSRSGHARARRRDLPRSASGAGNDCR